MKLVVVESPTKAKTLSRFLGNGFQIEASMGHVRDLPSSKLGVDIEKNFKPEYVLIKGKGKAVAKLQKAAKASSQVILATDPDREGEAIAYHVRYILKQKTDDFCRIVFHEITKEAVEEALKHPGKVNLELFHAQEARRILDRLVGYKLSPILWKKIRRGLSAGRVQSVAVRLVVEREKEIEAFKAQEYWLIKVDLKKDNQQFETQLVKIDNQKSKIESQKQANLVVSDLKKAKYQVDEMIEKTLIRNPLPPLITSTMQRSAGNRFSWTAKKTMRTAQELYEKGLITYHRTDSFNLAQSAVNKCRDYILKKYGQEYLPDKQRFYKRKSKMVQAAHEAIRPTKVEKNEVEVGQPAQKLYQLIWERFVISQMKEAILKKTIIKVRGEAEKEYLLEASGEQVVFKGFLKVNPKLLRLNVQQLPQVLKNDELALVKVKPEQKFTQPPARYTEASLIKELEQKGIGRPSTYAPILSTIQSRQYVEKQEKKLKPTAIGLTVTQFLVKYFDKVMDYDFTALMEDDLDKIAEGKKKWPKVVKSFFTPFSKKLTKVEEKADRVKIPVEKTGKKCPKCKKGELVIRTGRFGKFLSCSKFPECKYTQSYQEIVKGVKCPECGGKVVNKKSRRGRQFYGCSNYPKCKWASWNKPK